MSNLRVISGSIGGKKSDRAYDIIKQSILFRHYMPETQLLEQSLATDFSCSQSTVREALLKLAEDGLVERRGYRGTFVTNTSLEEAVEMVRVRLSIERKVASTLSQSSLETHPETLERILEDMEMAHMSGDLFHGSELDRQFHSELARVANMGLLSPILQRCALHIHRFTLSGMEVPREFFQETGLGNEHRNLLKKILNGSKIEAEQAVTIHLADVLKRWAPSLYKAVGMATFDVTSTQEAS